MRFEQLLAEDYQKWREREFVFQKREGIYYPITFGDFIEQAVYLAETLIKDGLLGKKIIVYGENSIEWMIADIAIMSYVGISIGLSKEYRCEDIENIVEKLEADAIIFSSRKKKVIEPIRERFPDLKYYSTDDWENLIGIGKELAQRKNSIFDFAKKSMDECVKVVMTSGTTSFPKAVMLSQRNIFAGWESLKKRAPMDTSDVCYLFLPLHHTYGGIYNFIYSLISGMQIYLSSATENIAAELLEVEPTVFCAVPLIFKTIYDFCAGDLNKLANAFGKRAKYLFTGGAYLDEKIRLAYRESGLNLLVAYALSETASSFSIEYSGSRDPSSVGTIFEDIIVKIDNPNENGEGELLVKGDNVFLGYMNNPEATRQAFVDGFFKTGDIGYIDAQNNLYLTGRIKNTLLTSKGENIYPDDVENRIQAKSANINKVKVFLEKEDLCAHLYIKEETPTDYKKIIEEYNLNSPKRERIVKFEVFVDSVDNRLKQ